MARKLLVIPVLFGVATLAACSQSAVRSDARLSNAGDTAVAQGASDSVGRYIANDTATVELTMQNPTHSNEETADLAAP